MIIVPKKRSYTSQDLTDKLFTTFSILLENTYQSTKQSTLMLALEYMLIIVLDLSIILNRELAELWNCIEITSIQQVISYLTPQGILKYQGSTIYSIVTICIFALVLINVFTLVYLTIRHSGKSAALLFAAYLFKLTKVAVRPILNVLTYNILSSDQSSPIRAISFLLTVLFLCQMLLYVKLYYNPLPKNNHLYQIDNQYEFYDIIVVFLKIVLLNYQGELWKTLLFILFLEGARLLVLKHQLASPVIAAMSILPSQITLMVCLFALTNRLVTSISQPLFYFWCIIIVKLLVSKWMDVMLPSVAKLSYSCCTQKSRGSICELLGAYWQLQRREDLKLVLHTYLGFFYNHLSECQHKKCYVKVNKQTILKTLDSLQRESIERHIDSFLLKLLEEASLQDEVLATLYYLHLYAALHRKMLKDFTRIINSLHLKFLVFHFARLLSKDVVNQDYRITDENFLETKHLFFNQLKRAVGNFNHFFRELLEQHVRLVQLEQLGEKCCNQLKELQKLFRCILSNGRIDLTLVEFYMEFVTNFLGDTALSAEIAESVGRKRIMQKYEDYSLEECSQPTLEINLHSATIINMNMEATKLLGYYKSELVEKTLQNVIVPSIDVDDWIELFANLKETPTLCLCHTHYRDLIVVRINSRVKQHANKKQYFLQISEVKQMSGTSYGIVQPDLTLESMSHSTIQVSQSEHMQMEDIFYEHIKPSWTQLTKHQTIVLDCGPVTAVVDICNCIDKMVDLIRVDLRRSGSQGMREQTLIQHKNQFFFNYTVQKNQLPTEYEQNHNNQRLTIEGSFQMQKNLTVSLPNECRMTMTDTTRIDYSIGVKTYRLTDDRIINVELEKSELEQYNTKTKSTKKEVTSLMRLLHQNGTLRMLMILVVVLGSVGSIYAGVQQASSIAITDSYYQTYGRIETFELRFYRIACILRDTNQNLVQAPTIDWVSEIYSIINSIQQSQTKKLFSDQLHTVLFLNVSYTKDLDSIFNVVLASILEMLTQRSTSITEDIHFLTVHTLQPLTYSQKQNIRNQIQLTVDQANLISKVTLIFKSLLIIIFVILALAGEFAELLMRSEMLLQYRIMSDAQLESRIGRLQSFENMFQQSQREIELDIFDCLADRTQTQNRAVPKHCIATLTEKKTLLVSLLVVVTLGIGMSIYIHVKNVEQYNLTITHLSLNRALTESYVNYLFMTVDAENGVNETILNETSKNLAYIEKNYLYMPFSSQFNQFIQHIYFENCCDTMMTLVPNINCLNFSIGTFYQDPFEEGLDYYFHHVYFNIQENITETIPSTGLTAGPFMLLIERMLVLLENQWAILVNSAITLQHGFVVVGMLLSAMLFLQYWVVRRNEQNKRRLIRNICKLIRKTTSQEKQPKVDNQQNSVCFQEGNESLQGRNFETA